MFSASRALATFCVHLLRDAQDVLASRLPDHYLVDYITGPMPLTGHASAEAQSRAGAGGLGRAKPEVGVQPTGQSVEAGAEIAVEGRWSLTEPDESGGRGGDEAIIESAGEVAAGEVRAEQAGESAGGQRHTRLALQPEKRAEHVA